MNKENNFNEFLEELNDLYKKYNICVEGCGCCGSPWLRDTKTNETKDIIFDEKENKYGFIGE